MLMIVTCIQTGVATCITMCPPFFCAVYVNDVLDLFGDSESKGLILLVPVRLGSEALNSIYIPCVKVYLLTLPYCTIIMLEVSCTTFIRLMFNYLS